MTPKAIMVRKLTVFRNPWMVWIRESGGTYRTVGRFRTWAAAMRYAELRMDS